MTAESAAAGPTTALEVGPRPNATRIDFSVGDRVDASVDVGTGNLLVTTTDLTLPGISGDVQFGLDFNSLLLGPDSPLPSGPGWATRLGGDTKLVSNADGSVLYLAPGGLEGRYVPTGGGNYSTPAGFKNTLTKTGTTWSLRDHQTNAVSTFDAAGKLTTITDRNQRATTLTYGAGGTWPRSPRPAAEQAPAR